MDGWRNRWTDRQTDGQNCDGQDALKAVVAFARKNSAELEVLNKTADD